MPPSTQILGNVPASHSARMPRMLDGSIQALVHQSVSSLMLGQSTSRIWLKTYFQYLRIHNTLHQSVWPRVIIRPLAYQDSLF